MCNDVNIYSWSCLIDEEGDSFLLTGGVLTLTRTSRYSSDRWLEDLDDLNTGRSGHACGWFTDTDGRRVRSIYIDCSNWTKDCLEILMSRFQNCP